MKQGVWWMQPLKVWVIIFCKVWKWHLMQDLICFSVFLYHYINSSVFLKIAMGLQLPSPLNLPLGCMWSETITILPVIFHFVRPHTNWSDIMVTLIVHQTYPAQSFRLSPYSLIWQSVKPYLIIVWQTWYLAWQISDNRLSLIIEAALVVINWVTKKKYFLRNFLICHMTLDIDDCHSWNYRNSGWC